MKWGTEHPDRHDLSTLRLLGTRRRADQPRGLDLVPRRTSAAGRCPIVDTWWQTETGGIMITPLPGVTTTKPGSATLPFPGVTAELVDAKGKPLRQGGGFLTLASPGRACCARSTATTSATSETYWSRFPGRYFTGDGAKLDEDGY